jgi:DNA-binding protein HU-beta
MVYKNELIRRISRSTRLSHEAVSDVMNEFEAELRRILSSGDSLQVTGFGSFYTRKRGESKVPSIKTGEMITIPAGKVVGFRAGETLKKAVRGKSRKK